MTYIIPKGKFDTIEYDSDNNEFIINIYNGTSTPKELHEEATQELLNKYKVKINLEKFTSGSIRKPISIPESYKLLENEENSNFFDLFTYPILGLIDAADVCFFLMMMGGCINLLIEMNAFISGMEALGRVLKGHEIILLIAAFILVSIGGTTSGMCEEILSFYPVLMPIFIKSGIDGALAGASLYFGAIAGNMFSIINPFAVGLGSDSAGINFTDGIVLRIIGFILMDALIIGYFLLYNRRVKKDPLKSAVYDIREELNDKFLKDRKEDIKEQSDENSVNIIDEEALLKEAVKDIPSQFTIIQKISLILFALGFVLLAIGVAALDWWFEQLAAIFLFLGIIFLFMAQKGEVKGIQIFVEGAGEFSGVNMIIGLARGINLTLDEGLIADTILNALTYLVDGLPKVLFSIIMFFVFIILGFFIQSCSGLAVLSMPVLAPLADEVNISRAVVVNAYMFGQNWISFLTPTGMTLLVLQSVGMKYTHWIKFIWRFLIVLFVYSILMLIVSTFVD